MSIEMIGIGRSAIGRTCWDSPLRMKTKILALTTVLIALHRRLGRHPPHRGGLLPALQVALRGPL